jgi:hypothetical protein
MKKKSRMPSALGIRVTAPVMLLAWLLVSGVHAQGVNATSLTNDLDGRSWVHESWTVKDGLPVNSINSLLQDRAGYIWAATFDGLVRFDGIRFTVFNSANSEGPAEQSNHPVEGGARRVALARHRAGSRRSLP